MHSIAGLGHENSPPDYQENPEVPEIFFDDVPEGEVHVKKKRVGPLVNC
jgi:hypothetical protein